MATAPVDQEPAGGPGWPCGRCRAANPLTATACLACGTPFLAEAHRGLHWFVPGVGDLMALTRPQRLVLGVAVALLASGGLTGLGYLAGHLL